MLKVSRPLPEPGVFFMRENKRSSSLPHLWAKASWKRHVQINMYSSPAVPDASQSPLREQDTTILCKRLISVSSIKNNSSGCQQGKRYCLSPQLLSQRVSSHESEVLWEMYVPQTLYCSTRYLSTAKRPGPERLSCLYHMGDFRVACNIHLSTGRWVTHHKDLQGENLVLVSMGLSEPCMNTGGRGCHTFHTLKGLCCRKENTFQQRHDPDNLSFALSLAWEHFLLQLIKITTLLLLVTLTGKKEYPKSQRLILVLLQQKGWKYILCDRRWLLWLKWACRGAGKGSPGINVSINVPVCLCCSSPVSKKMTPVL